MKNPSLFRNGYVLLAALLVLLAAACHCDADELFNNDWELTEYGPKNAPVAVLDPSTTNPPGGGVVTLTFTDDRVGGKDGCNTYGGVYLQEDCQFSVDSIITTLIACSNDIMSQAGTYMDILGDV